MVQTLALIPHVDDLSVHWYRDSPLAGFVLPQLSEAIGRPMRLEHFSRRLEVRASGLRSHFLLILVLLHLRLVDVGDQLLDELFYRPGGRSEHYSQRAGEERHLPVPRAQHVDPLNGLGIQQARQALLLVLASSLLCLGSDAWQEKAVDEKIVTGLLPAALPKGKKKSGCKSAACFLILSSLAL